MKLYRVAIRSVMKPAWHTPVEQPIPLKMARNILLWVVKDKKLNGVILGVKIVPAVLVDEYVDAINRVPVAP